MDAARLKPFEFHTSEKTKFCETRNGRPRRNAFWLTRSLALREHMPLVDYNLLELLRLEKIVLPLVYIFARVYILHGPSWKCMEELDDVTNCS